MQLSSPNYRIPSYSELPFLNAESIHSKVTQEGKSILLFQELVLDLTNFQHPGNNSLLRPYFISENFNQHLYPFENVIKGFQSYGHSKNAQLLIGLYTVGRLENYQKTKRIFSTIKLNDQDSKSTNEITSEMSGKKLYGKVHQNSKNKLHEQAMKKIDFGAPVFDQLQYLSVEEKEVMTEIPKILRNPEKIVFKKSFFSETLYTNNFWVSTFTFQLCILVFLYYIVALFKEIYTTNSGAFWGQLTVGIILLLLGIGKWTALEYYFHRFRLHYSLREIPIIGDHYMHHVFPNKKNKLALSVSRVASYMVIFYFFYTLFMSQLRALCMLLGILVGLTFYDIIHYYCHFGPQTNIKWVNYLKRNHLKHHFRDQNRGFGVTNTFWDSLFGTEHLKL